ncbi:AAA family ATPase [Nonomuraea sp. M3C6]|uniref:AAA family ATPase n=1 Tax=Nonomuraea marmarensis TaxID=3351344 RepID=A0ABW7AFB7_9ACTN
MRLILLCGLPGSGKTTPAKRLAAELPAVRLCPDEWLAHLGIDLYDEEARDRLEQLLWLHAQDLLKLGQTVILEFGFWSRAERDELRRAAHALGAAVELRYLAAPLDELCRRLESRNEAPDPINREQLEQWATLFEAPTPDEISHFDKPERDGYRATRDR